VTTATFSYTGSVQTWVCPAGVTTVTIEGWGAEGGSPSLGTATPGKGGYEIISIATAEDIGWIDVWTEFTPYSTTTGHYSDNQHPTQLGSEVIAGRVFGAFCS